MFTKNFKEENTLNSQINQFCDTNDISFNKFATKVFERFLHQNNFFDAYLKDIDNALKIMKANLQDIAKKNDGVVTEEQYKLNEFIDNVHDYIRTLPQWIEPDLLKDRFYKMGAKAHSSRSVGGR